MKEFQHFESFDPLEAKTVATTEVKLRSQKNGINGILTSYVGWYDPFCETIQNAMDAVDKRAEKENGSYEPTIWITIDIKENRLIVTDNGIGLDESQFKSFLTPFFSFKSKKNRGHKGVGATYLAYGFNYIQLCTKTESFTAVGKMLNAKDWVEDESPSSRPEVTNDMDGPLDKNFMNVVDTGVSICIHFDKHTFPKDLNWVGMNEASAWLKVLRLKTALGAINPTYGLNIVLNVIDKLGNSTQDKIEKPTYLRIHDISPNKSIGYKEIQKKKDELHKRHKNTDDLPSNYKNRLVIYGEWDHESILSLDRWSLTEEEKELLKIHKPYVYCAYVWSVNYWKDFHRDIKYRISSKILQGGIQLAANNMPQGETVTIPLGQNISRQNNAHVLVHFEDYTPDLGRKNYKKELIELAQKIASKLVDILFKYHKCLKPTTGGRNRDELSRQQRIEEWKKEMEEHEKNNPLELINENFFIPTKKVSITSFPSREQDVIALFNQMIAGGVIRGIQIMATNERSDYDGLYRILIDRNELHIYDPKINPIGVLEENLESYESNNQLPFRSVPKVLEYKFSLDGLIENIDTGIKNSKNINLVVVWETGEEWRKNYRIVTTLHEDCLEYRKYHGVTHIMRNLETDEEAMDLIVLKELIEYLNNSTEAQKTQFAKYEEYDE